MNVRGAFCVLFSVLGCALVDSPIGLAQRQSIESSANNGVVRIQSAGDVVQKWTPENRVFVKGNVGVSNNQLQELAEWLASHGPHWTVVLLDRASGERYTSDDNRLFTDVDAVEMAIGPPLSNKTGFGELIHPITHEQDGTVIYLALADRLFGYRSSDAQDRRDLGQSHWRGELDQEAVRAMRNGGRLIDAVKNTVSLINQRLDRAVKNEVAGAARREEEQKRVISKVTEDIAGALDQIQSVRTEMVDFIEKSPQAVGPLAKAPTQRWKDALDTLERELDAETARSTERKIPDLVAEVTEYLNAYAFIRGFADDDQRLNDRISKLQGSEVPSAKELAVKSLHVLEHCRASVKSGDLDAAKLFAEATDLVTRAEEEVKQAEAKQLQLAARRRLIRNSVLATLGVTGAIGAGTLLVLNRRRKPVRDRAIKELQEREKAAEKEIERVDSLFQRNEEILGSRERIEQRGYVGQTKEVSQQAFDFVDDLFIMSKEVKRVLSEARELVQPKDFGAKLINLFAQSRFERAVGHISGKPIRFTRATGLPLILRKAKSQSQQGEPAADKSFEIPDEVSLTFEEIFEAFRQRGADAENALRVIEECLGGVQDLLNDVQKKLSDAHDQDKQLDAAASQDGLFDVPNYIQVLLPSIQADAKEGDDLAGFDAVRAVRGPLAEAQRKLGEASRLGELLLHSRTDAIPSLQNRRDNLRALGFDTDWILRRLQEVNAIANGLFKSAASVSITSEIDNWKLSLDHLVEQAAFAEQLATDLLQKLTPELDSSRESIHACRIELARRLSVPEDRTLRESDRDPMQIWERAHKNADAGRTALMQGNTEAAVSMIGASRDLINTCERILQDSTTAEKTFADRVQAISDRRRQLQSRVPAVREEVERARQAYTASALKLVYSDVPLLAEVLVHDAAATSDSRPASPSSASESSVASISAVRSNSSTADQLIVDAEDALSEIQNLLLQATDARKRAAVLASSDKLAETEAQLNVIHERIERTEFHLNKLAGQSRANEAEFARIESLHGQLLEFERDRLVTLQTLREIRELSDDVSSRRSEVNAHRSSVNPFELSERLGALLKQLQRLSAQAESDRQAYAEAERAVVGATRQLEVAQQYVHQSQSDGIADSQLTVEANRRIAGLARDLQGVRQDLQSAHADWQAIDQKAIQLQANLSSASQTLSKELQSANQALQAFQEASQRVFQAERWSGAGGIRVSGAPGVRELERARANLQSGNYNLVLEVSRIAAMAAQAAIQQAERELERQRLEAQRAAEQARREREAVERARHPSVTLGGYSVGPGSYPGAHSSSSSPSIPSPKPDNNSGFGRSGW